MFNFFRAVRLISVFAFLIAAKAAFAQTCAPLPNSVEFIAMPWYDSTAIQIWENGQRTTSFGGRVGASFHHDCMTGVGTGPAENLTQWVTFDLQAQNYFDTTYGNHIPFLARMANYVQSQGYQFRGPIVTGQSGIGLTEEYSYVINRVDQPGGGCMNSLSNPSSYVNCAQNPPRLFPIVFHDNQKYHFLIHATQTTTAFWVYDAAGNLLASHAWSGSGVAISGGFGFGVGLLCSGTADWSCDGYPGVDVLISNLQGGWF